MIKAWIDGACEPVNPGGVAAYGVAIVGPNDRTESLSGIVGSGEGMSNNVAEYSALIALLEWYKKIVNGSGERPSIEVFADSQLVVNQMKKDLPWKIHPGKLYSSYAYKAKGIILDLIIIDLITFTWIPREQNWLADELSKKPLIEAQVNIRR